MQHSFIITPASKRDVQAISRVHVDTWRTTYNRIVPDDYLASLSYEKRESMWGRVIAANKEFTHLFVAKDHEGNVVGFSNGGKARTTDLPFEGEIYAIYLRKEFQGRRLGKDLFLDSLEQLSRDGFRSAILWVLEENPACKFYEAMGGKFAGEKWEDIGGKLLKEVAYGWDDILSTLKSLRPNFRHSCIKHYSEIQEADNAHYPGSAELLSIGSPFGRTFGLKRLAIHHEVLKPGRRTSWPHAESTEEEFVYVIEGHPQAWIDGDLYNLKPGDAVGFVPGTGIAHTFINNTQTNVRLLVVGDTNRGDNKCIYPLNPKRNEEIQEFLWTDAPKRRIGSHDGLPDNLRDIRHNEQNTMTTGTLQLTYRPLAAADASAFQRFLTQIGQETVFTMQYGGKPQQEEAVIAKKLDDAASDPRSLMLGAFHEDRLAALISLRPATGDHIWTNHIAGFGLMVIKEFWGQGVATHLLQEAEEYALKVGFKRIEAEVRCQNERGVRFYKRQGYEIEGTRRAAAMIKGEIHDEYFIAKLLDETTR